MSVTDGWSWNDSSAQRHARRHAQTPRGVDGRRTSCRPSSRWAASPNDAGPVVIDVVRLDLRPLNVMSTPNGLVVIDWANARRGDPATDVANTWSLLACADPPVGVLDRCDRTMACSDSCHRRRLAAGHARGSQ